MSSVRGRSSIGLLASTRHGELRPMADEVKDASARRHVFLADRMARWNSWIGLTEIAGWLVLAACVGVGTLAYWLLP